MTDDPLDRLRAADPLRGQVVPAPTSDAAVAMRDEILAGRPRRLASPTTRRWVVGGAVLAAGAAAAAALAVRTSPVTDPTRVGCYAGPSVTADTVVIGASGGSPVAQCRELWQSGDMDPAVSGPDEVPALVACALGTGVGVFPAGSCDDIETDGTTVHTGAEPSVATPQQAPSTGAMPDGPETDTAEPSGLPLPDVGAGDEAVRRAIEDIRLTMLDRCLTLEAAIALAEDTLADHGIAGWTVGPIWGGHTDETCAGFFPDADEQAIWFTAEPAQDGQTPGPR